MKGLTGRPDLRGSVPFPLGDKAASHFMSSPSSGEFKTRMNDETRKKDFDLEKLEGMKGAFCEAFWTYVNTTLKASMQEKDPNFGSVGVMKATADTQAEKEFETQYDRLYAFYRKPVVQAKPTLSTVKLQKQAYYDRRAELAKIMGIDDKGHSDHGSNYKPNDSDYDIIKNLLKPTQGTGRAAALAALKETFGYEE